MMFYTTIITNTDCFYFTLFLLLDLCDSDSDYMDYNRGLRSLVTQRWSQILF